MVYMLHGASEAQGICQFLVDLNACLSSYLPEVWGAHLTTHSSSFF